MAIKKSDLYSSIWASCDALRGGMDAGQYKDYVLFLLFIKYVSDKYGNTDDFAAPVVIPKGASFRDMVALKGRTSVPGSELPAGYDLAKLALEIDRVMRERAPAGWKGDHAREAQVLNALFPLVGRDRAATQALFDLVKNQPGYA